MPLQFTKNQILVLKEFFNNTHKSYYLRELARLLKKEPGVFQRDINKLEKDGILESYYQGKNRFFKLNREHALFEELKSIISKTVGIEMVIKKMIEGVKGVEEAFIYGSFAQNSENLMSDVDVFVIGDVNEDKLIDAISKLEKQIGREINYTLMTNEEFLKKKQEKNSFLVNIFNKKIIKLI
jgi:predicted nucleotidyltransferase